MNLIVKNISFGWRISLGVPFLMGIVLTVGMFLLPRSPRSCDYIERVCGTVSHVCCLSLCRWLVKRHRDEQALRILTKIYRDPSRAQTQLEEIRSTACSTKKPFIQTVKNIFQWKILQRYVLD